MRRQGHILSNLRSVGYVMKYVIAMLAWREENLQFSTFMRFPVVGTGQHTHNHKGGQEIMGILSLFIGKCSSLSSL